MLLNSAKKYILFKELGDTTQAIFAKYIFDQTEGENERYTTNNSCLFTLDNILAIRCKLLEVPCCAKDHSKDDQSNEKHRRFLFFRPIEDINDVIRTRNILHINETIKHNESVKYAINHVLNSGFYIGTTKLENTSITEYIKSYFESIKDTINFVNVFLNTLLRDESQKTPPTPEENIRTLLAQLRANDLFKVKRSRNSIFYQLITTVRNLFLDGDNIENLIVRTNTSNHFFKDILLGPSLDVIKNFNIKLGELTQNRKTIYDQISYLKNPSNDIVNIINLNQNTSGKTGGWQITKKSTSKPTPMSIRSYSTNPKRNINIKRRPETSKMMSEGRRPGDIKGGTLSENQFKEKFKNDGGVIDTDASEQNPDTYCYYDANTLDFLWVLFNNLIINKKMSDEYYKSSDNIENHLNYIEDFAFFMYPYFRFLGEVTFDISKLQYFHDNYYIVDNPPTFTNFIRDYVTTVIIPREIELVNKNQIVLSSNQHVFLKNFGLNNQHIMYINTRMNTYLLDPTPELPPELVDFSPDFRSSRPQSSVYSEYEETASLPERKRVKTIKESPLNRSLSSELRTPSSRLIRKLSRKTATRKKRNLGVSRRLTARSKKGRTAKKSNYNQGFVFGNITF
jgi:hypothetical protein